MYLHFISLATIFLKRKNFFPWRNKLGLWVTTLLSMELFSIISSACYNQFPKQNGSGLRNEILKCMSIPTPRSYTPGCTINPYRNCSRFNTYKFYWAEWIWIRPYKKIEKKHLKCLAILQHQGDAWLIPTKIGFLSEGFDWFISS